MPARNTGMTWKHERIEKTVVCFRIGKWTYFGSEDDAEKAKKDVGVENVKILDKKKCETSLGEMKFAQKCRKLYGAMIKYTIDYGKKNRKLYH